MERKREPVKHKKTTTKTGNEVMTVSNGKKKII